MLAYNFVSHAMDLFSLQASCVSIMKEKTTTLEETDGGRETNEDYLIDP